MLRRTARGHVESAGPASGVAHCVALAAALSKFGEENSLGERWQTSFWWSGPTLLGTPRRIRAAPDGPNVCETHASTTLVSRDVPSAARSTQILLTGLDPQRTQMSGCYASPTERNHRRGWDPCARRRVSSFALVVTLSDDGITNLSNNPTPDHSRLVTDGG